MTELLKRWADVEGKRASTTESSTAVWVWLANTWRPIDKDLQTTVQAAILLAAVIEAIEARGWDWNLTSMLPWNATARRYVATVTYHVKEADSDVAALLTAYLAALETEAGQ